MGRVEPGTRPTPGLILAAALPPLAIYTATVCRTAFGDFDSAEFATAVPLGGVPHAPGYPLYMLFARVVSALFAGHPALGVNFASSLAGSLGCAAMFVLVLRLTASPLAGLTAAWTLAVSFTYWLLSVVAEVYVFQAALELALLAACASGSPAAIALFLGLGLANHPSTVLVAVPVLFFLFGNADRRRVLRAAPVRHLLLFCTPGLLYLYLPIACHTSAHPGFWVRELGLDLASPSQLWWYLSLKAYPSILYRFEPAYLFQEFSFALACLVQDLGLPGTALAAAGWVILPRRNPAMGRLLLATAGVQLGFYLGFTASDKFTMFCPAFAVLTAGVGIAVAAALEGTGPKARPAVAALLLLLPAGLCVVHWPEVDKSGYRASDAFAEAVLSRVDKGATVLAGWQAATVLDYFASVRGMGPGVEVRHYSLALQAAGMRLRRPVRDLAVAETVAAGLADEALAGRPIYATFGTPELVTHFERQPVGSIYKLTLRGPVAVLEQKPSDWPVGPALVTAGPVELLGLDVVPPVARAGQIVRLRYRWRLGSRDALGRVARTEVVSRDTGKPVGLGLEARRSQDHRIGLPSVRTANSGGPVFVDETLDFSLAPARSDTALAPGDYRLAVGLSPEPSAVPIAALRVLP